VGEMHLGDKENQNPLRKKLPVEYLQILEELRLDL
jgi:hypothetical protein